MTMYKLLPPHPITNEAQVLVQRVADNTYIPFDPANTDYQEYLRWCEAGNVPEPADEVTE